MTKAEIARAVIMGERQVRPADQRDFWEQDAAESAAQVSRAKQPESRPLSAFQIARQIRSETALVRWRAEKPDIRGPSAT